MSERSKTPAHHWSKYLLHVELTPEIARKLFPGPRMEKVLNKINSPEVRKKQQERRQAAFESYRAQFCEMTNIDSGNDPACRPEPFHRMLDLFCKEVDKNSEGALWDFPPGVTLAGSQLTDPNSNHQYVEYSFLVTGTGSDTLTFLQRDDFSFMALDDVSLTAATTTTPLPATLPLFATGLGALGLLGWRRKRKARVSLLGAA